MNRSKLKIAKRVSNLMYATVNCQQNTYLVLGDTNNPKHLLDAFSGFISEPSDKSGSKYGNIKIIKMRHSKMSDGVNLLASCMKPVYAKESDRGEFNGMSYSTMAMKLYTIPMTVKFGLNVDYSQFKK